MSAATKKPLPGNSDSRIILKDSSITSPNRNPVRAPTAMSNIAMSGGIARNRSLRTAAPLSSRGASRRQSVEVAKASLPSANSEADGETRGLNTTRLEDMKERLRKGEEVISEYQRQTQTLQLRLDEAAKEQEKLKEKLHESEERIEVLENEKREAIRLRREIEAIYEAEKVSVSKEREDASNREKELQTVIQRLQENLQIQIKGKDQIKNITSSNNALPDIGNEKFATPSDLNRNDSASNSKLLLQKDRLIESLRMELAESQIKLVETENMGGGRFQNIEKQLLEARMANAKLIEDNESYQVLLSEKTLNGNFSTSEMMGTTLHNADALNALEGRTEQSSLDDKPSEAQGSRSNDHQQLEAELKSSKEQNKALTLYINNIIERLLKHREFEEILDKSSDLHTLMSSLEKDLPLLPTESSKEFNNLNTLQRAKTVTMGASRRPRPQSFMPSSSQSLVTDLGTAPSIPLSLNRANNHRIGRPQSEQFTSGAAGTMSLGFRGGPTSPGPQILQTPRNNPNLFVSPSSVGIPNSANRNPSLSYTGPLSALNGMRSESSSVSGDNGDSNSPASNSPPRVEKATTLAGNKPRPLRLLQESGPSEAGRRAVDDTTHKNAKRSSWMGWAFGKKEDIHVNEVLRG